VLPSGESGSAGLQRTAWATMKRRFDHRGFTQVELIVVIAIAGLLAAVAIPRFVNPRDFRELGFYNEALSAARYAQKLAVATGCQVQLTISGGTYTLNRQATTCTTGGFGGAVVNPGTGEPPFSGTAPADVSFTMTGVNPIVFDALGKTTDGTTRTVNVGSKSFEIVGATGYSRPLP
jgi:MSHA pilin protein MshC